MTDFSFHSDSSYEDAVEELLNQAMDHSVLEQIAKINCSSFSSDSVLPVHLENRFSRLKTFPATNEKFDSQFGKKIEEKPKSHSPPGDEKGLKANLGSRSDSFFSKTSNSPGKSSILKLISGNEKGLKQKLGSGSGSSPSNSPNSSPGNAVFSPLDGNEGMKKGGKPTSRTGSFLSHSSSSDKSRDSPSPPKKSGCFWCSPKKDSRKKCKENREIAADVSWGGKGEEFLSDLSVFSAKNQQKLLKKAMKEEEKISREAEKIVKWAKQASARMNFSDIEDELSDSENLK